METKIKNTIEKLNELERNFYIDESNIQGQLLECIEAVDEIFCILKNAFEDDEDAKVLIDNINHYSDEIVDGINYSDYLQLVDILCIDIVELYKELIA